MVKGVNFSLPKIRLPLKLIFPWKKSEKNYKLSSKWPYIVGLSSTIEQYTKKAQSQTYHKQITKKGVIFALGRKFFTPEDSSITEDDVSKKKI